jgi:hypothetical protein
MGTQRTREDIRVTGILATAAMLVAVCAAQRAPGQCEVAKLLASDGGAGDRFGMSPAIGDDVIVLGTMYDDDGGTDAGAAYVFGRVGPSWVEVQKLTASDAAPEDAFGWSIDIDGDVIVVGAPWDDDLGSKSGAAYVFRYDGSIWVEEQKLLASGGAASDIFGYPVAISGDVIMVGAHLDDEIGTDAGAVHVFRFNGSNWVQEQKLTASDGAPEDYFGLWLDLDQDEVIVSAIADDDAGERSGSAYVFRYDGSSWIEEQKLVASDAAEGDQFGYSIAVDGQIALISSSQDDDLGEDSGSAYVFAFDGFSWNEQQKLLAMDGAAGDWFGLDVAISGDHAIVTAGFDDDNGTDSGSCYGYRYNGHWWAPVEKMVPADGMTDDSFGAWVELGDNLAVISAHYTDDLGEDSGSAYVLALGAPDCNDNFIPDACDIADGTSEDLNGNGIPDECEEDCPADIDGDGDVDTADLLALLAAWGACP